MPRFVPRSRTKSAMITGVITSCPTRVSFLIVCRILLTLLTIAWISPRYPESIGGSSHTKPLTARLLLGNTYPAYPSGISSPKPRGILIISPGFSVQSKGIYTSAPAHFPFQALSTLTEWTSQLREKERRTQIIQIFPDFQDHDPHFIRITSAGTLPDHMLPLIGSCTDKHYISKCLGH